MGTGTGGEVRVKTRHSQDRLAEIQNILFETITGNRIVKAFNTEIWELLRFRKAARRLVRANLRSVRAQAISSPLMDLIGAHHGKVRVSIRALPGNREKSASAETSSAWYSIHPSAKRLRGWRH